MRVMTSEIARQVVEEGSSVAEIPVCCATVMASVRIGSLVVLRCQSCSRHWRSLNGDLANLFWVPISKSEFDGFMADMQRLIKMSTTTEIAKSVVEEEALPSGDLLVPPGSRAMDDPRMREICKGCGHIRLWHFQYLSDCTAGRFPNVGSKYPSCDCKVFKD